MAIQDFTNKNAVQLLATQSRRTDISSTELCKIHFEMGKFLAYEILDEFTLKEIQIQHVQGVRKGMELDKKDKVVILAIMRAGLYAAEGVRSVFSDSQFILDSEAANVSIDWKDKVVIIVDAVINSGKTVLKVIEGFHKFTPKKIIVATLILQKEAMRIVEENPDISFYALRISENRYVGKGEADTGNRLFNTIEE